MTAMFGGTGCTATTATGPSPTWRRGRASRAGGWSAGCGFADYDRDGDLDLFVSRYVKFDLAQLPEFGKGKTCNYRGIPVQCGPRGLPGEGDFLFRNDGERPVHRGGREGGRGRPPRLFRPGDRLVRLRRRRLARPVRGQRLRAELPLPEPEGRHVQGGRPSPSASPSARTAASRAAWASPSGDYDNSGRLSLFVTNFAEEYNAALPQRRAPASPTSSFRSKTAPSGLPYVGLGDRVLRLRQRRLARPHRRQRPRLPAAGQGAARAPRPATGSGKLLYHNRGDGTFDEVAARVRARCSPRSA